ncbi:integrase, catalytic region, zinc finger, CCHC-type containing protein [Tanacetum coccineum]
MLVRCDYVSGKIRITQVGLLTKEGRSVLMRGSIRFRDIGNESQLHGLLCAFQHVDDMKNTHQAEHWTFLPRGYVQIYTIFKAYEPLAKDTQVTGQLNVLLIHGVCHYDQIANLLSGFQKCSSTHNNQLRTSSNQGLMLRCMMVTIVTELRQRRSRTCDGPRSAVAFMANLSSTSATNNPVNEVHSNDNQIFDNVDYQLSQEMHQEEHLDSDAETEIDDNTIPYHQYLLDTEAQNVPTEVSADTSDKVSMIAILTDLQTQLDGHAKVNQEKCLEIETLKNELLQCKQEICRLDTQKVKLDLENKVRQEQALVIQRNKRNAELEQENVLLKSALSVKDKSITLLQSEKEKILSEKKELADSYLDEIELSREQAYWLPANENASQASNPDRPVTPFIHTRPPPSQVLANLQKFVEQQLIFDDLDAEYERCVLDNKNLTIEKKNLLIRNDGLIAECLEKDICSIVLTSDIVVPPSSNCLCEDLRSACDREHTKVLELEAEVLKQQKDCIDTSSASNAIFEINKLRKQLQGKDDTIRNLDAQISIMKVLNVGSTEGSCDQQALETDRIQLKDTITSLRIQLDGLKVENLSALTTQHTKLQAQVTGKTSSGPSTSETPKVLAPGMYNLGSKYIPPPKRANWVKTTPLPKKKQVTFSEPPKPSLKPTQKPVVHPNKQTNVCVPMSTGVKPTSGASKTVPKRAPRNHSSLPAKSANARRVEAHHRTLNKKNRVDSNLLVKHSVSVSNLNNVCGACNKSLVFANHNDCLVMCDDSVNVKPHQTKRRKHQPKKEWKPIKRVWKPISKPVTKSKPQWQPTGRHFSLFEKYPFTRIMEPTDMPIDLPPSASSSPKITMVVQIVLWYLDSGCSRHMTGDRARLINFVEKFIGTVRFGNDEYAAIVGYGDYKLGDTIISRVYYVEGLKHNLFSVGQFCDGGLEVAFRQHSCHIRNYDMVDLLTGSRSTNLYSISLNDMLSASPVCLLTKASSTKSWLWHRRLNHLNFGTLNELARKNLVRGLPC